jgi:hypothetical protein
MSKDEHLKPSTRAEKKLLELASTGERCIIGDGQLPSFDAEEDFEIRASLIRQLLSASQPDVILHEKGLRLRGAKITGTLDLQGVDCSHDITIAECLFEKPINLVNAKMRGLHLNGSHCAGIVADHAVFSGSVFLRAGFQSTKEIALPGAAISGDLQICDAKLSSETGYSIFAASCHVDGSVYLGDYPFDEGETELHSNGAINFASAVVGKDFFVRNCAMSAKGLMDHNTTPRDTTYRGERPVLSLLRAKVGGVFGCRECQISGGFVDLSGASVRRLNDDPISETNRYVSKLDGFEYEDFSQEADISVPMRLKWLENRPVGYEFATQPFEQFARVLTKMGHRDDARAVLLRKEHLQRKANRTYAAQNIQSAWRVPFMWVSDTILRFLIGYGYRPLYVFFWTLLLIIMVGLYFQKTWTAGDMAPNAAPILISQDWISATETHPDNPAEFWSSPDQAGKDYETFHPYAYAADLLIPIVDLGQEKAWAPSTSRSPWGRQGWWLRWFVKTIGWVMTALGAAALTGVIRRD